MHAFMLYIDVHYYLPVGINMKEEEWSIREFRALHACITQGSITGGARQIGISQPAVSRAIANLEYKMGTTLFERSGKSIIATEEAIRINQETSLFFLMLDQMRTESVTRHSRMNLKIAAPPNYSFGFIQSIIASFLKAHKNTRIELEVCASPILIDKVARNEVDIGISDMQLDTHNIVREPFGSSAMACFLPINHSLTNKASINIEDLRNESLIGLTKNHLARTKLENLFRKQNIDPNYVIETNTSVSALEFVSSGVGIVLMNPFPIASFMNEKITALPFEHEIEYSPAFILPAKRAVKKSTRWFMSHLKEELKEIVKPFLESTYERNDGVIDSLTSPDNYFNISFSYERYFTFRKRFTLMFGGDLRITTNRTPIFDSYYVGGSKCFIRHNDVAFYGFGYREVSIPNFVIAKTEFRAKIYSELYGMARLNYFQGAKKEFGIVDNAFNPDYDVFGYALGLGFNSIAGPINVWVSSNTMDENLWWYFSFGYNF